MFGFLTEAVLHRRFSIPTIHLCGRRTFFHFSSRIDNDIRLNKRAKRLCSEEITQRHFGWCIYLVHDIPFINWRKASNAFIVSAVFSLSSASFSATSSMPVATARNETAASAKKSAGEVEVGS